MVHWRFVSAAKGEESEAETKTRTIPLVRHYSVFNLDQTEGVELPMAELGSAFCCAHCELDAEHLQHPEYIGNWIRVLKGDKRAIFTASAKAKAAAEFLIPALRPGEETEDRTQIAQPTAEAAAG